MKTVTLWKCRLCSTVVQGPAEVALPEAEIERRIAGQTKAARIALHKCSLGAIGVTDLVGAMEVPE